MRNTIQGCREDQEVAPDALVPPMMMVAATPLPVPVTSKAPAAGSGSAAWVKKPCPVENCRFRMLRGLRMPNWPSSPHPRPGAHAQLSRGRDGAACRGFGSAACGRGQSPHVLRPGDREAVGRASTYPVRAWTSPWYLAIRKSKNRARVPALFSRVARACCRSCRRWLRNRSASDGDAVQRG